MTREEAISVIMFEYPPRENYPTLCDALDMAIEALRVQEWIPCEEQLPETSCVGNDK